MEWFADLIFICAIYKIMIDEVMYNRQIVKELNHKEEKMIKKITLNKRIRHAFWYIVNPKHQCGVFTDCSICKSNNIDILGVWERKTPAGVASYSRLKCLNCGAIANDEQMWDKNLEDVKE